MNFYGNGLLNQTQPSNKIWNTAFYIRLSREDGDKLESDSVSSQKDLCSDFLMRNPDMKLYDIYI